MTKLRFLLPLLLTSACTPPASSDSTEDALSASGEYVTSPKPDESTSTPLWVRAHVVSCNGAKSTSFGYSVDDETAYHKGVTVNDIDTTISPAAGAHVLHVKAWSSAGECPTINVPFTMKAGDGGGAPSAFAVPANATVAADLESSTAWEWNHDPGTPGSSSGTTEYEAVPGGGEGRRFDASYSDAGGEIYHLSFANDEVATHFVYDNWVYVTDPSSLENLELDMNQVLANGDTVIYGFQCASGSKTWEYTVAKPTGGPHWVPSNVACDSKTWTANAWHHVQVAYDRDDAGVVTYQAVALDGQESALVGATGSSAYALGWGKGVLLTNFQLDGAGASGSITIYAKQLTISRW